MSLTRTNTGPFHGNPSNFTGPKTLLKSQSKEQWLQDQYSLYHFLVISSLEFQISIMFIAMSNKNQLFRIGRYQENQKTNPQLLPEGQQVRFSICYYHLTSIPP